ncbi:hypothetical protein [Microbulbifer epialgicus]|uniref:Serine/threonine-protein kinase HipA n=1 Tax=Microbulbifer epialgicus TaxID=393907 RepID=A0ABV4NVJ5_9GAMM
MSQEIRKIFIRLSMWNNEIQGYLPVGTLVYDNDPSHRLGFVGFSYDRSYVEEKWPAVDPAHLDPHIDGGRFVVKGRNGHVPHYFASFLPGEFGQQLLSEVDQRWEGLTEAEKLYVMTLAHGDFGAPQLNPQNDQFNQPIRDLDELSRLVQAIREFQNGASPSPITSEIQGALCSFRGPKPKVDYEEEKNGVARRFVAKLNTTGYYNDARITATFTTIEKNAGISVCENQVVPLDCGEEVLLSYNYARTEQFDRHDDGDRYRRILKYNRISFKTLLAEDPVIGNTERPNYRHIVHAIDRYSADPISDKEELFRRAVLSAATNHTSNGLENMEMYDKGMGNWRLSPSFHNLPNPMTDAQFEVGFGDGIMTGNLLRLDERFLVSLGSQMGFNPTDSLALAYPVTNALVNLETTMDLHDLSSNDRSTARECVRLAAVKKLHSRLSDDEKVQNKLAEKQKIPTATFEEEAPTPRHRSPGM